MRNLITVLAALGAALVLGLMAPSAAAAPITQHFHGTWSDSNDDDNQCGIAGTSVSSGMDNFQLFADGSFQDEGSFTYVFTSAATGKSLQFSGHDQVSGPVLGPIENGDGTITFITTVRGVPFKLKIPNGPTLSLDVGYVTFYQTYNPTTGELISEVISPEDGPHPSLHSDTCDLIVPALT
jgi:hypothetical protein